MSSWSDPLTVTAAMSAIAAIAAAIATWRAPLSAARMGEELRKAGDLAADSRRFKSDLFATLMQERSEIYSIASVKALNSIDVAFSDALPVREAWAELYQALDQKPVAPDHVIDERLRKLLREIAVDLGVADKLRIDDFGRVYMPRALAEERSVRDLRRKRDYESLIGVSAEARDEQIVVNWPPAPGA